MPPAFVLSQDQTLKFNLDCSDLSDKFTLRKLEFDVEIISCFNSLQFLNSLFHIFNFQCAAVAFHGRQCLHTTISKFACQQIFGYFFKFFQTFLIFPEAVFPAFPKGFLPFRKLAQHVVR